MKILPRLFVIILLFFTAIWIFWAQAQGQIYPWLNHDTAALLNCGRQIDLGSVLYVDWLETGPPGILMLYFGLAKLSQLSTSSLPLLFHYYLLLLGFLGSILLLIATKKRSFLFFLLIFSAYSLQLLIGNFDTFLYNFSSYDIGQREQQFGLLFAPYLLYLLHANEVEGQPFQSSFFKTFFASYQVLLGYLSTTKPFFAILLLLSFICFSTTAKDALKKNFPWVFLGVVLPFIFLLMHSSRAFLALFTTILPIHFDGSYRNYFSSDFQTYLSMTRAWLHLSCFLIFSFLLWKNRKQFKARRYIGIGFLPLLAWLFALMQGKYWSYHFMLLFGLLLTLGAYLLAIWVFSAHESEQKPTSIRMLLLVLLMSLQLFGLQKLHQTVHQEPLGVELAPLFSSSKTIMPLSIFLYYSYAPIHHRSKMTGPRMFLYDYPALQFHAKGKKVKVLEKELALYFKVLRSEIEKKKPQRIIIDPLMLEVKRGYGLVKEFGKHRTLQGLPYKKKSPSELFRSHSYRGSWIVYDRNAVITKPSENNKR